MPAWFLFCLSFLHKLWPKFANRWISRIGSLRLWWNSVQRKALIRTICSLCQAFRWWGAGEKLTFLFAFVAYDLTCSPLSKRLEQATLYCSREMLTKKCQRQQNFDSDPKEEWHYNHVTFTPIANNFMLYCKLIYMLSMPYVRLITIKGKVGIPESFKVGWYPQ